MGLGLLSKGEAGAVNIEELFTGSFNLHWAALLPAGAILIMSALKANVRKTMFVSIVIAFFICLGIQHMELSEVFRLMVLGYRAQNPEMAAMLNGGGIISMVKVASIVCLSSSYAGIFKATGLLNGLKGIIAKMCEKITSFGAMVIISVITSMIACNQTLAIMLTHQLCLDTQGDNYSFAIDLENSVVLIAPLIPWSIAAVVPLATIDAPISSLLAACFLYFVPLWSLVVKSIKAK